MALKVRSTDSETFQGLYVVRNTSTLVQRHYLPFFTVLTFVLTVQKELVDKTIGTLV